ncbi:MAG: hypothetical protein PUP91_13795 [Rhizonema sp. PD37]|nr:hypothetical protein [Rhizonema sp. PD37]
MQIAIITVFATMIAVAIGFLLPSITGRKPAIALGTLLIAGGAITQITKKE